MRRSVTKLVALAVLLAAPARAHGPAHAPAPRAERAADPVLRLPEAGSYELPPISRVAEHVLLAPDRNPAPLLGLAAGQLAVVSFVYASCPEAGGCPRALAVLQDLDRRLAADAELAGRVRLVTLSFDPARDTPARMGELRTALSPRSDWRFLTAAGPEQIRPVLDDFGQDALALVDAQGHDTGILRHVLKVFLVDSERAVRNVYSAGFLSADLLLLDIRTLQAAHTKSTSSR